MATTVTTEQFSIVLHNRTTNQDAVVTVKTDGEHIILGGYGWIELYDHDRLHERQTSRAKTRPGARKTMNARELRALRAEYIELRMAEELDNVDSSLSTLASRDKRLAEIDEQADTTEWEKFVQAALANPKTTYSSGAPYHEQRH